MIVEPAMMNCGVILPEPGYLQGLKDLCHAQRRLPRVRRGEDRRDARVRRRGRGLRRRARHRLPGQGDRRRHAVRRDRRRPRSSTARSSAASTTWPARSTATRSRWRRRRATLTEVLMPEAYEHFNRIDKVMQDGLDVRHREVRSAVLRHRARREGLGHLLDASPCASTATRSASTSGSPTSPGSSSRTAACSSRRGPSRRPGRLSVAHTEEDAQRYIANFEEFAAAVTS